MFHYTANNLINSVHPVNVHVVGAGGTGSLVVVMMARIDYALRQLGHEGGFYLTVFDPDTVSEANLGRQNYSQHDLHDNKAKVLVERVNRFHGVNYSSFPVKYSTEALQVINKNPDIVISCTDTGRSRVEICSILKQCGERIYWLDIGNSFNNGQCILGTVGGEITQPDGGKITRLPTILDFEPNIEKLDIDDNAPSCSLAEALRKQNLFINELLATYASGLVFNMFREGRTAYHGCFCDLANYSTKPITIESSYRFFNKERMAA